MGIPYRARVDERWLLDLPGSRNSGFVYAYVEDTSECGLRSWPWCDDDCDCCADNYEPEMILEISDGGSRVRLEFDADVPAGRANSLHKLDTLIAALRVFRSGLEAEFVEYDRRERELSEQR